MAVQEILRHSKIQTTLGLYTQEDSDETLAAEGGRPAGARSQYECSTETYGLDCTSYAPQVRGTESLRIEQLDVYAQMCIYYEL
jgi:hypothetical protein